MKKSKQHKTVEKEENSTDTKANTVKSNTAETTKGSSPSDRIDDDKPEIGNKRDYPYDPVSWP
ncbi:MAG: hypothetical protein EOO04_26265 [Chitinophagaceae bacterium]|nr:MAG: hypothetical protein EOO04_26265 [Chitinophagaceae bacterium]